jgi:uncharacterized protein involved in outer membrane biogenesis
MENLRIKPNVKRLNIVKIIITVIALIIFHFATGLFISPAATQYIITQLNKNTAAKISLEKAQIWPLTLNVRLINLKVFDPNDTGKRIVSVPAASFRLSVLGLLSKRLVISRAVLENAEISLEGRDDGSFNIQDIIHPGQEKSSGTETLKKNDVIRQALRCHKE